MLVSATKAKKAHPLQLRSLGHSPASDTKRCKEQLYALVSGDSITNIKTFEKHFPIEMLSEQRKYTEALGALFKLIDRGKA
jgi:hypothetical protein